jgi:hypothetical protein
MEGHLRVKIATDINTYRQSNHKTLSFFKITLSCQALVPHTCNTRYSGGRDQENCSSKPAQANSLQDPISKKPFTKKKDWWSGSRCRPQYPK